MIFINHSCNPNSFIKGKNELVALKDISINEEITFDYSTTMWENAEVIKNLFGTNILEMKCFCKHENCRKVIGQFYNLPVELQEKYLLLRIVPDFILRKNSLILLNPASK